MVHRVPLTVTRRGSKLWALFFLAPPPHMVCLFSAFSEHYCPKKSLKYGSFIILHPHKKEVARFCSVPHQLGKSAPAGQAGSKCPPFPPCEPGGSDLTCVNICCDGGVSTLPAGSTTTFSPHLIIRIISTSRLRVLTASGIRLGRRRNKCEFRNK